MQVQYLPRDEHGVVEGDAVLVGRERRANRLARRHALVGGGLHGVHALAKPELVQRGLDLRRRVVAEVAGERRMRSEEFKRSGFEPRREIGDELGGSARELAQTAFVRGLVRGRLLDGVRGFRGGRLDGVRRLLGEPGEGPPQTRAGVELTRLWSVAARRVRAGPRDGPSPLVTVRLPRGQVVARDVRSELGEFFADALCGFDRLCRVVGPSDVLTRPSDPREALVGELGEPLAPLADLVEHVVVAEVVAVRAGSVAVALVEPVGVVLVPSLVVLLRRFDLGVHGRRRARGLDDGRAVAEVGWRERGGRRGGRARRQRQRLHLVLRELDAVVIRDRHGDGRG